MHERLVIGFVAVFLIFLTGFGISAAKRLATFPSGTAQVAAVESKSSGDSKEGELKKQCERGHEYTVSISQESGAITRSIETTKVPPIVARKETLPPGKVKFPTKGGLIFTVECKDEETVEDVLDFGPISESKILDYESEIKTENFLRKVGLGDTGPYVLSSVDPYFDGGILSDSYKKDTDREVRVDYEPSDLFRDAGNLDFLSSGDFEPNEELEKPSSQPYPYVGDVNLTSIGKFDPEIAAANKRIAENIQRLQSGSAVYQGFAAEMNACDRGDCVTDDPLAREGAYVDPRESLDEAFKPILFENTFTAISGQTNLPINSNATDFFKTLTDSSAEEYLSGDYFDDYGDFYESLDGQPLANVNESQFLLSKNDEVTTVYKTDGVNEYYDNYTGKQFMRTAGADDLPSLVTPDAYVVQTSKEFGPWTRAVYEINGEGQFSAFEEEYFGSNSVEFTPDIKEGKITTRDSLGNNRKFDIEAYRIVQSQGDQILGTSGIRGRIERDTNGKIYTPPSWILPEEAGVNHPLAPTDALTTLPATKYAQVLSSMENEINKYPSNYWDSSVKSEIYVYEDKLERMQDVKIGGYARSDSRDFDSGVPAEIFVKRSILPGVTEKTFHHEIAHVNDRMLPRDDDWASEAHGSARGRIYGGSSGAGSIVSGKVRGGRPEGFADVYGYAGGVKEDKATVVENFFVNYPALISAAENDSALKTKVDMVKQGYYDASGGVMDDDYWQNLTPINLNYTLPEEESVWQRVLRNIGF